MDGYYTLYPCHPVTLFVVLFERLDIVKVEPMSVRHVGVGYRERGNTLRALQGACDVFATVQDDAAACGGCAGTERHTDPCRQHTQRHIGVRVAVRLYYVKKLCKITKK